MQAVNHRERQPRQDARNDETEARCQQSLVPPPLISTQVLLERRSSLLEAASEGLPKEGRRHRRGVAASVTAIRGLLAWAAGGLGVAYALLSVVEEELLFNVGGDRVVLAAAQVL